MRKLALWALVAALGAPPVLAQDAPMVPDAPMVQDGPALWDLGSTLTIQDLGLRMATPNGWVMAGQNGIRLAASQADLAALTDNDPATNTSTVSISLIALPFAVLGVAPGSPLTEVANAFLKVGGIIEASRTQTQIAGYPAITVRGINAQGRPGVGTIWIQPDPQGNALGVLLTAGGPQPDPNLEAGWDALLATVIRLP